MPDPTSDPDPPTTRPRSRARGARGPAERRCSRCATACPPVVETEAALRRGLRGHRRRHRPGRDRRRAGLRLPLLLPRLPDPAAPRGRRHRAGRPDRLRRRWPRCRRPSAAPSGSCTPPPRTCPACARSACAPTALFDTELAGRLLGYPRVGLATLVETLLGYRLRKEHSAVDWSTRPLPEPWLEYAALDVEVLVELRDVLAAELESRPARPSGPARSSTTCAASSRRSAVEAVAPYVRAAPGARPPGAGRRPRAVGGPRRDRRASAT